MVVRTGWNTAAGSMLREVVASSRPPVENMSLVQVNLTLCMTLNCRVVAAT